MSEMVSTKSTKLPLNISLDEDNESRMFGSFEHASSSERKPALPLAKVSVEADVVERLASVKVVQTFVNLLKEPIEAVYIFPLAGTSAVSKFQMKIGQRTIDGIVKERAEGRREYRQAVSEGKRAALLEQERDDVFTAQVGNIMPGEEITVTIIYSERLSYFDNGHTELRLPLVVAPRFMPGQAVARQSVGVGVEADTSAVPDASRISPPRLAKGFNPHVDLDVTVNLQLTEASEILDLSCSQHAVKSTFKKNGITISLAKDNELLNRDFVLSWKLAQAAISSLALLSQSTSEIDGEKYNYGMVSINPPARADQETYLVPRDIVFLLDRSGSMEGAKMSSASNALALLLNTLTPRDRFSICAFDDRVEWFSDERNIDGDNFFPASLKMLERGQFFLKSIKSRGGTVMHGALLEVGKLIADRKKKKRQAIVIVITDGQIGNESQIFQFVQKKMADSRVFSVGIDTAVNDGFLKRLANLGGGTCSLVTPGEALEEALTHVSREIGLPLITGLHLDEEFLCAPSKPQDLFEGRPVSIFFRVKQGADIPEHITVSGQFVSTAKSNKGSASHFSQVITLLATENEALPQLYARSRVSELEDMIRSGNLSDVSALQKEIIALAVSHGLLTRFTAFVAIDHEIVAMGDPRQLVQPVEHPDQWQMSLDAGDPNANAQDRLAASRTMTLAESLTQNWAAPSASFGSAGGSYGAPMSLSQSEPQLPSVAAQPCPPALPPASFGQPPVHKLKQMAAYSAPGPVAPPAAFNPFAPYEPEQAQIAKYSIIEINSLVTLLDKLQVLLSNTPDKIKDKNGQSYQSEFSTLQLLHILLTAFFAQSALALEMVTLGRLIKWDMVNLLQSLENKLEAKEVTFLATACSAQLQAVKDELEPLIAGCQPAEGVKKTIENDQFWNDNI